MYKFFHGAAGHTKLCGPIVYRACQCVMKIVNCFINRVDVYREYKLHIDFNFDYRQFVEGLDCIEAA